MPSEIQVRYVRGVLLILFITGAALAAIFVFRGNTEISITTGVSSQAGISYPTVTDYLLDKGKTVIEFDMYFPSLNRGIVDDMFEGFSGCPCHMEGGLTQVGDTITATSPGEEVLTVMPAIGYEKMVVLPEETMDTGWSSTPWIRPNDVYEIWQQNYSVMKYSGTRAPFWSVDNVGFNSVGRAQLTRNGTQYDGWGNFWKATASQATDTYLIPGLVAFWGVVTTPTYQLQVEKNVYSGGTWSDAFVQDLGEIAYRDGSVYPVQMNVTSLSCTGETYTFVDPRTSSPVTANLLVIQVQGTHSWGCENGVPHGEVPSTVVGSLGYYGWIRHHPSG